MTTQTRPRPAWPVWAQDSAWLAYTRQLAQYYTNRTGRDAWTVQYQDQDLAPAYVLPLARVLVLSPHLIFPAPTGIYRRRAYDRRTEVDLALRGLIAHEAGHVRYSCAKPAGKHLGEMWNILEDERIERRMRHAHRHARVDLTDAFDLLGDVCLTDGLARLREKEVDPGDANLWWWTLAWRWAHDQPLFNHRPRDPRWAQVRPLVEAAWVADTSEDVVDLARQVLAIIGQEDALDADQQVSATGAGSDDREEPPRNTRTPQKQPPQARNTDGQEQEDTQDDSADQDSGDQDSEDSGSESGEGQVADDQPGDAQEGDSEGDGEGAGEASGTDDDQDDNDSPTGGQDGNAEGGESDPDGITDPSFPTGDSEGEDDDGGDTDDSGDADGAGDPDDADDTDDADDADDTDDAGDADDTDEADDANGADEADDGDRVGDEPSSSDPAEPSRTTPEPAWTDPPPAAREPAAPPSVLPGGQRPADLPAAPRGSPLDPVTIESMARTTRDLLQARTRPGLDRPSHSRGRYSYDRQVAGLDRTFLSRSLSTRQARVHVSFIGDRSYSMTGAWGEATRLQGMHAAASIFARAAQLDGTVLHTVLFDDAVTVLTDERTPVRDAAALIRTHAAFRPAGCTLLYPALDVTLKRRIPRGEHHLIVIACDGELDVHDRLRVADLVRRRDANTQVLPLLIGDDASLGTWREVFPGALATRSPADLVRVTQTVLTGLRRGPWRGRPAGP